MKKKLARILAIVLVAMMVIPAIATMVAHAAEIENTPPEEIVNLYDPKTATKDAQPSKLVNGATTPKTGELAAAPIAVKWKQVIYVGPCTPPTDSKTIDWTIAWYDQEPGVQQGGENVQLTNRLQSSVVDTFVDGSVIYAIKVQAGVTYAALRAVSTYFDYTLMTIDQPFDKEGYFAYADAQGWDVSSVGLRPALAAEPAEDYEGLWNYFPRKGDRDPSLRQHQNNQYVMSGYIRVNAGDVINMGALSTSETRSILYAYDSEFAEIKNYKRTDIGIDFVENIGYNFAIYSHTVPENVAYVKVCVHSGIYNDGDILVTKNQSFTGAELRTHLGIDELSDEAKAHAFYNKEALFVGDSISYGSYDTPPTYRNPSASWARRLALATGLIPYNVSYPGASVGKTGLSNVKWEYDLLKTAMMGKREYDMIVFQGGVNDARQDVEVGEALPVDTDRKILAENDRVATFAGGLQLMFKDAKDRWPEAELYYVANFKLVDESVKGKDMAKYYEQAQILCAEYGVHYIDLYNDVALYEVFDYESTNVLPDLIHPTSASYDLLFPAILRLFNKTLEDPTDEPTTPTTPTTPDDNQSNEPQEEPHKPLSVGVIAGIAAGAVVVVGGGVAAGVVLSKKKKSVPATDGEKATERKENKEDKE